MREREIHLSTIDWQFVIQFYEHIKNREQNRIVVEVKRKGQKATFFIHYKVNPEEENWEMTYNKTLIDMK